MLIHIHVGPTPLGDERGTYAHVESAIRLIEQSGLEYRVGALGTEIQGSAYELWPLLRAIHEAGLESGAEQVMTHIRVLESNDDSTDVSMTDRAALITH